MTPTAEQDAASLVPENADLIRIAAGWNAPMMIQTLAEVLKRSRPFVFVHVDSAAAEAAALVAFRKQNYRAWRHRELAFNPHNYFRQPEGETLPERTALLAVHQEFDFSMPGLEEIRT
jgi:hypothetical protein